MNFCPDVYCVLLFDETNNDSVSKSLEMILVLDNTTVYLLALPLFGVVPFFSVDFELHLLEYIEHQEFNSILLTIISQISHLEDISLCLGPIGDF